MTAVRVFAQALAYALFAALIGYLATAPAYSPIDPEGALVTLSFIHAGQRKGECRQLTPEEIAKLPPNMRRAADCPRERLPVYVELELDGELLLRRSLRPSGVTKDRASAIYQKFMVPPGKHRLVARLRDSARTEGFDYQHTADVELRPQQQLLVDFRSEAGGFVLR